MPRKDSCSRTRKLHYAQFSLLPHSLFADPAETPSLLLCRPAYTLPASPPSFAGRRNGGKGVEGILLKDYPTPGSLVKQYPVPSNALRLIGGFLWNSAHNNSKLLEWTNFNILSVVGKCFEKKIFLTAPLRSCLLE